MKKLLSLLLVLCMCLSSVILLASCGKSAYDIAVEGGFVGTEEEWLASLKGTAGTDGKNGKDGKDGKDGMEGNPGINAQDAPTAPKGTNGKDGFSYEGKVSVSADGYWVIDGVKTTEKIDGTKAVVKAIQLVEDTVTVVDDAANAPTLKIKYTLSDDRTNVVDLVPSMIIEGEIDFTTEGVYPIKVSYSGFEDDLEVYVDGIMAYYENFDALTGKTLQEILTATGYKIPVPGGPEHVGYHDGTGLWYTPEGQDISSSILHGKMHNPNYIDLAVENGKLKYIPATGSSNESNFYNGKVAHAGTTHTVLVLLDEAYMAEVAKDDYTIQYNITVTQKTAVAQRFCIALRWNSLVTEGDSNGRPQIIGPCFADENIYPILDRFASHKTYGLETNLLTLFFGDTDLTTSIGNEYTVRMVVKPKTSEDAGYDVYMKLAAETDDKFKPVGSYEMGAYNTPGDETSGTKWLTADNGYKNHKDALAIYTQSITDGYYLLDDIAVWTGTSRMPADKSTTAYEALLTPAA